MKNNKSSIFYFFTLLFFFFIFKNITFSQSENVPVENSVYSFLQRMKIKGYIPDYSNSVLPLQRKEIAKYIMQLDSSAISLTEIEKGIINDLKIEFEFDISRNTLLRSTLFNGENLFNNISDIFSDKEKFIYSWTDDNNSLFLEGLFSGEYRFSNSDVHSKASSTLYIWGGNLRGTIEKNIGYSVTATNGQVFGNKDFAMEDPKIKGNYKINENDAVNFDFTEGYVNYKTGSLLFELGREKINIGVGNIDRLILSSDYYPFDFIRASVKIGIVNYTFLHSWLLGKEYNNPLTKEKVIDEKYLAIHRLGLILFNNNIEIGLSEMVVYGQRSPEIAYMTPLIFYKSVEHSLQDRDNSLLAIDARAYILKGTEIYGSFVLDDINFSKLGTKWYGNLFSYQGGLSMSDPLNINNLDFIMEYTRIDPYTYTHRLYYNNYTNHIYPIGPDFEPNSDKITIFLRYYLSHRMKVGFQYSHLRHGANITQNDGTIINYGGDINIGHRSIDSDFTGFLDGKLEKKDLFCFMFNYELFNELFLNLKYNYINTDQSLKEIKDNLLSIEIKLNY